MPPSFPTTSPVAVATARILAAYLSRHKLSPADAAGLSRKVAETLADLTSDDAGNSNIHPARTEEPAPRRRIKPREPRPVDAAVGAKAPATPADPEPDLEQMDEREPVPLPEPARVDEREPVPSPLPEPEPEPEPEAVGAHAELTPESGFAAAPPQSEAEIDAGIDEDFPRKRKRPSRPRSRRGKGAAAPAASDALPSNEAPGGEAFAREAGENGVSAPEADTEADTDANPEPITAEVVTGHSAPAPKPRRTGVRVRRATAP